MKFKNRREPKVTITNMDDDNDNKGKDKAPGAGTGFFSRFKRGREENFDQYGLTPTEERAVRLQGQGYSDKEIGNELNISRRAASAHLNRARRKMDIPVNTQRTKTGDILTPNLQRIKDLKDAGRSNEEIASELGIRVRSVVNNVTNINKAYRKAGKREPFTAQNRKSRGVSYSSDKGKGDSSVEDNTNESASGGRKYF